MFIYTAKHEDAHDYKIVEYTRFNFFTSCRCGYTFLLFKRSTGKQVSFCHMFVSLLKWHKTSVTLICDFDSEMGF